MPEISRIKIEEDAYNIKDAELRHKLNVLLGVEDPNEEDLSSTQDTTD